MDRLHFTVAAVLSPSMIHDFYLRVVALACFTTALSDVTLLAEPVPLINATADFSQPALDQFPSYVAAFAIDQKIASDVGWAIYPQTGQAHTIVFETVSDTGSVDGTVLQFTIYQLHSNPRHTIGKFRLSATTDPRGTFADGAANGGDVSANWTVLAPSQVTAANGTTFQINVDGSVLATGISPNTDTYTVKCATTLEGITGIRLEVLPDPTLPGFGPGRGPNGNFLLSEFAVDAVPLTPNLQAEIAEIRVRWDSRADRVYQVQYTSELTPGQWTDLGAPTPGTGAEMTMADRDVGASKRLYRVVASRP